MEVKRKKGKPLITDYEYLRDSRYFAQIDESIKDIGAKELTELGAEEIKSAYRGLYFTADKKTLYRINYTSRLISRVVAPVFSFACPDTDTLYRIAKQIRWSDFFSKNRTFAVAANVANSKINHSKFASLRLKDAIVDSLLYKAGLRPDVSIEDPDVLLNLYINNDQAVISIDTSGGSLHKRGYREEAVSAPMQETVAAAIIRLTQWDGSVPIYDPMCGSGTLLCEALMHFCRIPAGIFRKKFGFEILPDFDTTVWEQIKKEADANIRALPEGLIAGSDISEQAVYISKTNLLGLHFGPNVRITQSDFSSLPVLENQIIVANPPYGIRMGKHQNLNVFHKKLGDFLKQKCNQSTAYIYFGDRAYVKKMGLKASWKKPIQAGGLDGRLVKYEMY
ncbi:MAG: class I SAM-dependent RNA methyltransferase [Desulfobacterales bacterium]|nr:class I SAM-dependent RNA methyltransferase [Desulfobacterales bacterium]